jgi:G3E family GTPase
VPYREPEFLPWDGRRVPITFVGGYLGAGKTSVINALLAVSDRPIAVIVNDVGSINIDAALIRRRHGDTIELTNGCICCSSIEDMGRAFDMIRSRATPPDHLIIELSGVAEPQRMLPWGQSAGFILDGLIVVVAADQLVSGGVPTWIESHLVAQIEAADLLVLTKTDLVDSLAVDGVRRRIGDLAPGTPVLLGATVDRSTVGQFLALGGRRPGGPTDLAAPNLFDAHSVQTITAPVGLTVEQLRAWLDRINERVDGQVVRVKGLVQSCDQGLVLVQVVGRRCEITIVPPPEQQPPTDLVVISIAR